jgi:hypothetical protein
MSRNRPEEGSCGCLVCNGADPCHRQADATAVNDEVSVELCRPCYDDHRDKALEMAEAHL